MLEGLNEVDWKNVRHRNGPADNIPKLLLDLLSKDKKIQSSAILELFDTIWHHGTVYEATAPTVPFLYEVLKNPACFERFSVVWLLFVIANGHSVYPNDPPEKNRTEKGSIWANNAHGAVRQGVKTILGLLEDKDKDLRLPVVLLLASLPEEAGQIKPRLHSLLSTEESEEVRAGLGLALALLGDLHPEAFQTKNQKLPLTLLVVLAKACAEKNEMRASAYQAIEHCFLSTMEQKDKDWLSDEKILLGSIQQNLN